jgi:creatinine amidohydrolase
MPDVPRLLARATSGAAHRADLALVPVGSLEQHGPHLPLDTDTAIAEAVTHRVAARIAGAWVAPAVSYGSSGEHQAFPGTSSIGTAALQHVVIELTRSMRTWARSVVFVNGHGGNVTALVAAVEQLTDEGHDVTWAPCTVPGGDAHAGRTETSLMLYLRPGSVRLDAATAGNTAPLASLLPRLTATGVRAVSANGVLGDPAGASVEEGRHLLEAMVERVYERLDCSVRA